MAMTKGDEVEASSSSSAMNKDRCISVVAEVI
jgi:hypothetical protein